MDIVDYRHLSVDADVCVCFTNMQLQNDDGMWIVFSIIFQHNSLSRIELDVALTKSIEAIYSTLISYTRFDEMMCVVTSMQVYQ